MTPRGNAIAKKPSRSKRKKAGRSSVFVSTFLLFCTQKKLNAFAARAADEWASNAPSYMKLLGSCFDALDSLHFPLSEKIMLGAFINDALVGERAQ